MRDARDKRGPSWQWSPPISATVPEMLRVTQPTNTIFNSSVHLNMWLLLDKINPWEVNSCFEAVSYLLFLTGIKAVSMKSIFTKYETPRMKSVLQGSSCCPNSLNTVDVILQRHRDKTGPWPPKREITYKIGFWSVVPKYQDLWVSSA